MITVQYASDLHLEFVQNRAYLRKYPLIPAAEVLILAGDVVPLQDFPKYREFFDVWAGQFQQIFWVPGNHEYYHGDLAEHEGSFLKTLLPNLTLLNNQVVETAGLRLIFSTLWSKTNPAHGYVLQKNLNDFQLIQYQKKRYTPDLYNRQHAKALLFLKTAFQTAFTGPTVVVTHHVPTFSHYPEQYRGDILNEAFASDLDDLVMDSGAAYWIYGHHHRNIQPFSLGPTQLVTNQLGYVQYGEHQTFGHRKVLEVPVNPASL